MVADELASPLIGAQDIRVGKAGVQFTGDGAVLYRSNLWLRAAIRVLSLLTEVSLDPNLAAGDSIYEAFREEVDWPSLLPTGHTFSVDARIYGNSNFSNSQLLSVRARDAICDVIRDQTGVKPLPPDGRTPDMPIFVTAFQNQLRIYRDSSGVSLHRRGYRQAMHAASLNEAAAAGCLYLSGWPKVVAERAQQGSPAVLADPQCGSGTFLIEAALMATNTAPGMFRRFWPFLRWPDADAAAWRDAVDDARDAQLLIPSSQLMLFGNDKHAGALSLASKDIRASGMDKHIKLHHGECRTWELPSTPAIVMCNPPWGRRLLGGNAARRNDADRQFSNFSSSNSQNQQRRGGGGGRDEYRGGGDRYDRDRYDDDDDNRYDNDRNSNRSGGYQEEEEDAGLADAWSALGTFLKRQAGGAEAYILSGSTTATQNLRLRSDRKIPISIGGVDCRLLQYQIRGLNDPAPATSTPSSARAPAAIPAGQFTAADFKF